MNGVIDLDQLAANRAAKTLKDLLSLAEVARENGEDDKAAEYQAKADEIVRQWQFTRFDIVFMAKSAERRAEQDADERREEKRIRLIESREAEEEAQRRRDEEQNQFETEFEDWERDEEARLIAESENGRNAMEANS
jgi:hypothetical protein